jgi:hypothetical protein
VHLQEITAVRTCPPLSDRSLCLRRLVPVHDILAALPRQDVDRDGAAVAAADDRLAAAGASGPPHHVHAVDRGPRVAVGGDALLLVEVEAGLLRQARALALRQDQLAAVDGLAVLEAGGSRRRSPRRSRRGPRGSSRPSTSPGRGRCDWKSEPRISGICVSRRSRVGSGRRRREPCESAPMRPNGHPSGPRRCLSRTPHPRRRRWLACRGTRFGARRCLHRHFEGWPRVCRSRHARGRQRDSRPMHELPSFERLDPRRQVVEDRVAILGRRQKNANVCNAPPRISGSSCCSSG